jgi:hypothetical protein
MGRPAGLAISAAGNHPVRRDGGSEPRQHAAASSRDGPGVERTRATFVSYSKQHQAGFTADLRPLLADSTHIDLVQETFLAMARVADSG